MATRRDAGGSVGTSLPTQRSTYARHAIPEVQSSRAGLEGLGSVFNSFFGQVNAALDNVNATIQLGEKQKIAQENEAQKIQATNDFYQGRGEDPNLTNDLDYMDTFRGLKAGRMASTATRDFTKWYQQDWLPENPGGDLMAARDEWVKGNLAGLADPKLSALVISKFYQDTETTLNVHTENGMRIQIENDLQDLAIGLNDDVVAGDITPERVAWYINAAKQIDPLNPNEAAPRIIAGLMASVKNNPDSTQHVITTLTQPGTGIDGRSFADSFPDAFADFQKGALTAYMETNTLEEQEFFRGLEERIRAGNLSQEEIVSITSDLVVGRMTYGAGTYSDGLRDMLVKTIQTQAEVGAKVSLVGGMLDGTVPLDASHIRSNFDDYLQAAFGTKNFLDLEPAQASDLVTRLKGVVPENVKYQLTAALTNANNPQAQERAVTILAGIKAAMGDDYAASYLTNEGARYFDHISAHLSTNQDIPSVLSTVNEARANDRVPENLTWTEVTGAKTHSEAVKTVSGWVDNEVQTYFERNGLLGMFKDNINIPDTVMSVIEEYALAVVAERGSDGITGEEAVRQAVQRLLPSADIIGTLDSPTLNLGSSLDQVDATGEGAKPRIQLGYSVMSPAGVPVDTHQIYREELRETFEKAPFIFADGEIEGIVIDTDTSYPGAFQLKDSTGVPIVFEAGESFDLNGETMTFPETEEEMAAMFEGVLPKGMGFVKTDGMNGDGWKLMYRPHYGEFDYNLTDAAENYQGYNGVRTEAMILNDYQSAMIASQRGDGLIPMTTGINSAAPQPQSAEEVVSFLESEMARGINQGGYRFVDRHRTQYDQTYRSRRMDFIVGSEAVRTHAYDDRTGGRVSSGGTVQGNVTVGIGFNMDRQGARETWDKVFGGSISFDDVKAGRVSISKVQAETLFNYDMRYFENVLMDAADGRTLPENEHMALLSIAYNAPSRIDDMRSAIANGDHAQIVHAMLYESFNPNHPQRLALASRRYKEALLYAGSDPIKRAMVPSPNEYINHWR